MSAHHLYGGSAFKVIARHVCVSPSEFPGNMCDRVAHVPFFASSAECSRDWSCKW